MFRKAIIATLAVAFVTVATVSATTGTAEAKNNRHRNAAIAAGVIGLSAAIIGSAVAQDRYARGYRGYRGYDGYHDGYYRAPRHCFDEPVTRWSNYYGDYVVVGYRRVCD